jgi:hypothetical protein
LIVVIYPMAKLLPTDVQKLHEFIKEYFRYGKFDDSYECFDAEVKTKIVSKKLEEIDFDYLSDGTPELFKMMKGVSSSTVVSQKRQQQIEEIHERYLDLLAGARQIYGLAIKLTELCESDKGVDLADTDYEREEQQGAGRESQRGSSKVPQNCFA